MIWIGAALGLTVGLIIPIPIGIAIYAANGEERAAGAAVWMATLWIVGIPAAIALGAVAGYLRSRRVRGR